MPKKQKAAAKKRMDAIRKAPANRKFANQNSALKQAFDQKQWNRILLYYVVIGIVGIFLVNLFWGIAAVIGWVVCYAAMTFFIVYLVLRLNQTGNTKE